MIRSSYARAPATSEPPLVVMECCHRYDEILPSGATQSCHLNGSGLDCQIPLSET
jgi:hypothetical protein